MNFSSLDLRLAFLSSLPYYNDGTPYYSDISPVFRFLMFRSAFIIAAEKLTPEERKDFIAGSGIA